MATHSSRPVNTHSLGLKSKLLFGSLLAAWATALVLLTAVSPPTWTGHDPAGPDIGVSSTPDKPSWVADTDGANEPYHLYHSAVNRQNCDAKTTNSQWSFVRPICCHKS
jgi:hypothetical protein